MAAYLAGRMGLAGEYRAQANASTLGEKLERAPGAALSSLSDETLMERVGAQDRQAVALLVSRHLGRGVAVAFRMTASRAEAEDVVQDAFLRVWRSAKDWERRNARFSSWFHRVVINLCIDRSRKRKFSSLDAAEEIADPALSAEEAMHIKKKNAQIAAALDVLPAQQRAAITLCYYEGLSNREAADILETSVKAVESLLVRARRSLATELLPLKAELL